jgi:hypothetical protein
MSLKAVLAASVVVVLSGSPALACGGMVSPDGSAEVQGFEALLEHRDAEETLLVSVDYQAHAEATEFGWIMPLPAAPEIEQAVDEPIQAAVRITTPPREEDIVPDLIPTDEGEGVTAGGAPGVDVIGRQVVGGLRFVTLGGTDAVEVRDWMRDHGFTFHDRQEPAIQSYLDRGWVVVAARLPDGSAPEAELVPVRFRFPTEDPVYPLALAGTEHKGFLIMRLFVLTSKRVTSTTYGERVIPPGDIRYDYPAKHLELRYAAPVTAADARSLGTEEGMWLSRWDAHWRTDRISGDLEFAISPDQSRLDFSGLLADWRTQRTWIYVQRVAYPILLLLAILIPVGLFVRRGRRRTPNA